MNTRVARDGLMRQAREGNVGFRFAGSRLYRHVWLSEHEKRPLTRDEKDALHYLMQRGYVRMQHAVGAFGRGYYEAMPGYVFTTPEPDDDSGEARRG